MILQQDQIVRDLAPFADLGTAPPSIAVDNERIVVRLIRNGTSVELTFNADGSISERAEGAGRRHFSFQALLASGRFADLRRWADSQKLLLRERATRETLPVEGLLSPSETVGGVEVVDVATSSSLNGEPRVSIILIDGPAGIGKTSLIRNFAYQRAASYASQQKPLVLHVESRGRMLQNITDLMAFSLQTMRLPITYDQIPVLVKHGLIVLAIDGFDELGDPSGYELAWAQVNELVAEARGKGKLILSGRETFISRDRLLGALGAIDLQVDRIESFTIRPITPTVARQWLQEAGWSEETLASEAAAPLFESGSYALRPFFLSELAREGVDQQIRTGQIDDLLSFLTKSMIVREAGKFGRDVEAVTSAEARQTFVERLMEEAARDLAENQTDALPTETLSWLAEVVAHESVPESLTGILKNRAGVIAFLIEDDRRGYRRFVHTQVLNYFLSNVTVSAVNAGELPKFIRRNLIAAEFLDNFAAVARRLPQEDLERFVTTAMTHLKGLSEADRSRRNLAALLISLCSVFQSSGAVVIEDVGLDEVYMAESMNKLYLQNVAIAQLHARGADVREVEFDAGCHVISLVADESFVPSSSMPQPVFVELPDRTLKDPDEIGRWMRRRFFSNLPQLSSYEIADRFKRFPLFDLLLRIARYKPFWIRGGDDRAARRILDDDNWPKLKDLLNKHSLLVERTDVQASGRPTPFYHIKNRTALADLDDPPETLIPFLSEVLEESMRASF